MLNHFINLASTKSFTVVFNKLSLGLFTYLLCLHICREVSMHIVGNIWKKSILPHNGNISPLWTIRRRTYSFGQQCEFCTQEIYLFCIRMMLRSESVSCNSASLPWLVMRSAFRSAFQLFVSWTWKIIEIISTNPILWCFPKLLFFYIVSLSAVINSDTCLVCL